METSAFGPRATVALSSVGLEQFAIDPRRFFVNRFLLEYFLSAGRRNLNAERMS